MIQAEGIDLCLSCASGPLVEHSKHRHPDSTREAEAWPFPLFKTTASASDAEPGLRLRRQQGSGSGAQEVFKCCVEEPRLFILYVEGGSGGLKLGLFMLLIFPNVWLRA